MKQNGHTCDMWKTVYLGIWNWLLILVKRPVSENCLKITNHAMVMKLQKSTYPVEQTVRIGPCGWWLAQFDHLSVSTKRAKTANCIEILNGRGKWLLHHRLMFRVFLLVQFIAWGLVKPLNGHWSTSSRCWNTVDSQKGTNHILFGASVFSENYNFQIMVRYKPIFKETFVGIFHVVLFIPRDIIGDHVQVESNTFIIRCVEQVIRQ